MTLITLVVLLQCACTLCLRPICLFQIKFGILHIMTEHSLWRFSRALHRAINERQPTDLESLIDDDVDWAIYGPIDMFPFLGARRGKAAVLQVIRRAGCAPWLMNHCSIDR